MQHNTVASTDREGIISGFMLATNLGLESRQLAPACRVSVDPCIGALNCWPVARGGEWGNRGKSGGITPGFSPSSQGLVDEESTGFIRP